MVFSKNGKFGVNLHCMTLSPKCNWHLRLVPSGTRSSSKITKFEIQMQKVQFDCFRNIFNFKTNKKMGHWPFWWVRRGWL